MEAFGNKGGLMQRLLGLAATIFAVFALAQCSPNAPEPQPESGQVAVVHDGSAGAPNFDISGDQPSPALIAAMRSVFPNADALSGVLVVTPATSDDDGAVLKKPALLVEQPNRLILLVKTEQDDAPHVATGSLSVYYLDPVTRQVLSSFDDILQAGAWGAVGNLDARALGDGTPAILVTSSTMHQGCDHGALDVVQLGDAPKVVLRGERLRYEYIDDTSYGKHGEVEGTVLPQARAGHQLSIGFSGQFQNGQSTTQVNQTLDYDGNGDHLVGVNGLNPVPEC